MPEKHAPFMLAAITATGMGVGKVNIARLIEAVIIAGGTALITMYGVQRQTETQLKSLETTIMRIEKTEESNTTEVKQQVREVRQLVEQHILGSKK